MKKERRERKDVIVFPKKGGVGMEVAGSGKKSMKKAREK
jgi:hypothetical protein